MGGTTVWTVCLRMLSVSRDSGLQLSPQLVHEVLGGTATQPTRHPSAGDKARAANDKKESKQKISDCAPLVHSIDRVHVLFSNHMSTGAC